MLDTERQPGFKPPLRELRLTKRCAVCEGGRLTEIREQRFTGGLDTLDLKDDKALLDKLNDQMHCRRRPAACCISLDRWYFEQVASVRR